MDRQQKRLNDIARRISRGLPVNVTQEERQKAEELIAWNKQTRKVLQPEGTHSGGGISTPDQRSRSHPRP